jgi:hypothetical protein
MKETGRNKKPAGLLQTENKKKVSNIWVLKISNTNFEEVEEEKVSMGYKSKRRGEV